MATPPVDPVEPISARVPKVMGEWRQAILNKNADTVEALDSVFAVHPGEFIAALMASAGGDPDERVRSFSTRVLGKLRSKESAELMRKLLDDRSEYVRFNAAWALGELSDHAAASRLRRLQKADPSANVRRSAEDSLRRMEGG
ncbi:MAG: HEAT repeat domain-containing protein [Verrucomicrobiota bacterium]